MSCLRLLDEESHARLMEGDGVTTLAGGRVMPCLRTSDAKDPTKNLCKMTVSHHLLEDMSCHASACWM